MTLLKDLTYVAVALLALNDIIECTKSRDGSIIKRCRDITEALNILYDTIVDYMPLEARCRRYAALISMFESSGSLYRKTVEQIATMHEYLVIHYVQQIDNIRLSSMFIYAVDWYRATQLAPAMIDLLDCLKDFGTHAVEKFLGDKELIKIESLYRKVLKSPGIKLNLTEEDMVGFHPAFMRNLRNLFSEHLIAESGSHTELARQSGTSELQAQRRNKLKESFRKQEEQKLNRSRERDRLRQRRLRLLKPDEMRESERVRHRKRRERIRRRQKELPFMELQVDEPQVEMQAQEEESDEKRRQKQMKRYVQLQMEQHQRQLRQNQLSLERFGHTILPYPGTMGPEPRREPVTLKSFGFDPMGQQAHMPPDSISQSATGSMASFTSLLQHMEQQASSSGAFLQQHHPASDALAMETPLPHDDLSFRHPYQAYLIRCESTRQSDDLMSTLGTPQLDTRDQSRLQEDSASSFNQLDDTDTVVQSILDQPSLAPGDTSGFSAEERAALWLEFDREYERSRSGPSGGQQ